MANNKQGYVCPFSASHDSLATSWTKAGAVRHNGVYTRKKKKQRPKKLGKREREIKRLKTYSYNLEFSEIKGKAYAPTLTENAKRHFEKQAFLATLKSKK